jgi:hypothetical protein
MDFMQSQTFSQLVVTESAATCWMNKLAQSHIGNLKFNSQTVSALWGIPDMKFNTTEIGTHLPIFKEKLGANKTLYSEVNFKDVNVMFGKYDSDVVFEYTFGFSMRQDFDGAPELMYDELKMITSMNVRAEDDIVFIDILKNKLDIDNKYGQKEAPMRNGMNLTPNEYREFVSTFGFFQNYLKKWFNNVYFKNGIMFPYNPKEIYTTVAFQEKSMHVMLEVEEEADKFFEKELWDDEAKKNAKI